MVVVVLLLLGRNDGRKGQTTAICRCAMQQQHKREHDTHRRTNERANGRAVSEQTNKRTNGREKEEEEAAAVAGVDVPRRPTSQTQNGGST